MTHAEFPSDYDEEAVSRFGARLPWLILVSLGLLVYEITAQPALAIAAACIKFGWNDFLTARWFRRADPNASRGKIYFWLHIGSGLWKIAITATIVMLLVLFAVILVQDARGQRKPIGDEMPEGFLVAILTAFTAFSCLTCATLRACCMAWRQGVPLWLGGEAHRAQRMGYWPPVPCTSRAENKVSVLIATALFFAWWIGLIAALFGLFWACEARLAHIPPQGQVAGGDWLMTYAMFFFFLFLFLIVFGGMPFLLKRKVEERLVAARPEDCWPEQEP